MLKSTYKSSQQPAPLPLGWTEHKAPTGHAYYFNAVTQKSTYTRPSLTAESLSAGKSQPPYLSDGAQSGYPYGLVATNTLQDQQPDSQKFENRTYVKRSTADRNLARWPQPVDGPKSKHPIPDCQPWLLVETRLGRRFVHNTATKESFWKFPLNVMKAVVEYDRVERKTRTRAEALGEEGRDSRTSVEVKPEAEIAAAIEPINRAEANQIEFDSDEYEEVEVIDDEGADHQEKRQKTTNTGNVEEKHLEFNEDDIVYQLAAMGEDYGLDPGDYGGNLHNLEEGAQGLELTAEDSKALFFDLLDDCRISPYSTWEKIMAEGQLFEDDRYIALPTMRARKEVWSEWSRDRIQKNKERKEREAKQDPSIPYMDLLQEYATPKLFWPEFKRKYRKEAPMRDIKLSDKDREKWYREYINRLKMPESKLKADLLDLLKSLPLQSFHKSITLETLPPVLLKELRYHSLRRSVREPMVEAYVQSLPPASDACEEDDQEAITRRQKDRGARERALAERQKQVNEEKRRVQGALSHSRGMLRQEEEEVERARKFGKSGLLSHGGIEHVRE